jgi:quercetin dioxygenase-like cupin family protein
LPGFRTIVVVDGELASPVMTLRTGDAIELPGGAQDWVTTGGALVLELGSSDDEGASDDDVGRYWTEIAPGLRARLLMTGRRELSVVDSEPHATLGEHEHAGVEELYVIRGSCEVQGRWMSAGDYHRAMPGSHHDVTRAGPEGCVLVSSVRPLGRGRDPDAP